ncbi:MAG TPA: HAD-IC family P-type ATPase, partial [bacterium]
VVLSGRGLGAIELTGSATRYGRIAALLQETEAAQTPLQRKVHTLVRAVLAAAVALGGALFAAQLWRGHSVMESTVSALTLAMAAVPEEFPLVFTLYLSLGAWRLSRWGVLAKSLPSVEALGSVDVICTDKTGTLTEGRFQLEGIHPVDPALGADLLWQAALMACEPDPVDAMDMAIATKAGARQGLLADWRLTWDYPFEPQGKHMSHAWTHRDGRTFMAMKGAVEGVLEHCALDAGARERVMVLVSGFASQGKRLLGLACRDGGCVGDRVRDEAGVTFAALLVFSDPPRSSAKAAIAECQAAGIQVKMLTGDHPLTAHAVADETGLAHDHGKLYTGGQLAQLDKDARWNAYREGAIFSRVMPEQKHEMVRALQSQGQVVAMTGDGINDAPALKLADIGISMGVNATDVARSAAKMVLLQNDFRGIVAAVLEGRRIFANLQRSFAYLISFHLHVVLLALFPPFAGWGDLLLPVNIVLLELIVHPISAFAFENLPATSAPRGRGLLPPLRTAEAVLSGVLVTGASLILFRSAGTALPVEGARTLALAAVLFGNLGFVLVESWPLRSLKVAATGAGLVALTLAIILVPAISAVFHLSALSAAQLAVACAVGLGACVP